MRDSFLEQVIWTLIHAHVAKHNVASRRVLEKCGFTITGEDHNFSNWGGQKVEGFILKLE